MEEFEIKKKMSRLGAVDYIIIYSKINRQIDKNILLHVGNTQLNKSIIKYLILNI